MRERCEGCDTPTPRFTYTADDVALCAECARQLVADELDRLTTRCAELERALGLAVEGMADVIPPMRRGDPAQQIDRTRLERGLQAARAALAKGAK